jgi:RNA polymerase sigma-70 factor (ECF subfamily)
MAAAVTIRVPSMGFRMRSSSAARPAPARGENDSVGAALRNGEQGAIERVYERYSRTVFSYLVSRLGDRAAAEDVQQQVFAEVWQRSEDFDPERAKLFTWVMVIARSRATDHLRRAVPEPHEPGRAAALVDQRAETEPTDELIERWRVAELLRLIPAEEATMLRMRFYDGLSQREIAERTGTALGTVKMRMVQALDRMRTLIDEEGA